MAAMRTREQERQGVDEIHAGLLHLCGGVDRIKLRETMDGAPGVGPKDTRIARGSISCREWGGKETMKEVNNRTMRQRNMRMTEDEQRKGEMFIHSSATR